MEARKSTSKMRWKQVCALEYALLAAAAVCWLAWFGRPAPAGLGWVRLLGIGALFAGFLIAGVEAVPGPAIVNCQSVQKTPAIFGGCFPFHFAPWP